MAGMRSVSSLPPRFSDCWVTYRQQAHSNLGVILSGTATLLFWFGATFSLVLLARLFQGAASAAAWTAGLALIAEQYAKNRVQMMGFALAGSTAGSVLGPVAGGFL